MPINTNKKLDAARVLAVAPMLDWTDRHCRYFHRLLAPDALLYSQMIVVDTVLHADPERVLAHSATENPLVLQLGGSEPKKLAKCAQIAANYNYDEINLNVGCPSAKVQAGAFGAALMAKPQLVGDCVRAIKDSCDLPVSVKTRIGIDEQDSYQFLQTLVEALQGAGVDALIVHARKAWLKGLSPKQNRTVPPVDYARVYKLKRDFKDLHITINGGITTAAQIKKHLEQVDGVMIGREAYHNPYQLTVWQQLCFNAKAAPTRAEIVAKMLPYIDQELHLGTKLQQISRHILGLFHGMAGAREWRRYLSTHAAKKGATAQVVAAALLRQQQQQYETENATGK